MPFLLPRREPPRGFGKKGTGYRFCFTSFEIEQELYDTYKLNTYNVNDLEAKISKLFLDDEITNKKGIYLYVLDGQEKHLNLRTFTEAQKIKAYNKQKGKCPRCLSEHKPTANKVWDISEMEADHIKPWHLGGKTDDSNCQTLCRQCNREKGGK